MSAFLSDSTKRAQCNSEEVKLTVIIRNAAAITRGLFECKRDIFLKKARFLSEMNNRGVSLKE